MWISGFFYPNLWTKDSKNALFSLISWAMFLLKMETKSAW